MLKAKILHGRTGAVLYEGNRIINPRAPWIAKSATIIDAICGGISLEGANLRGAVFRDALLANGIFRGAHMGLCNFRGASIINCDFSGAILDGSDFTKATMVGVLMTGASLTGVRGFPKTFIEKRRYNDTHA